MTTPLRTAVIGVGHLGQHHARLYAAMEGVTLSCVVDTDAQRAREIGERFQVAWQTSYRDLVGKVDAVSVVVPTVSHFDVASFFLENGVHVLVEKPVTATEEQASRLEQMVRDTPLILQVGHIERFNPAWLAVHEKIVNPRFLEIHRLAPFKGRSTDVGVVLDLMIHDLDMVLAIVKQPIRDIRSSGVAVIGPHEDIVNSRVEFEGGCVANITASRISQKEMRRFRIFQPHCYLTLDYKAQTGAFFEMNQGRILETPIHTSPEEPLKLELLDFIQCVRSSTQPKVSILHGKMALAAAMQILQQIQKQ